MFKKLMEKIVQSQREKQLEEQLARSRSEAAYWKNAAKDQARQLHALTKQIAMQTDWRTRYDRMTGKHGREVAALKEELTRADEDIQRLEKDNRLCRMEVAERAETHKATREENAAMWMEVISLRQRLAEYKAWETMPEDLNDRFDLLQEENVLLLSELYKLDPKVAKRYAKGVGKREARKE